MTRALRPMVDSALTLLRDQEVDSYSSFQALNAAAVTEQLSLADVMAKNNFFRGKSSILSTNADRDPSLTVLLNDANRYGVTLHGKYLHESVAAYFTEGMSELIRTATAPAEPDRIGANASFNHRPSLTTLTSHRSDFTGSTAIERAQSRELIQYRMFLSRLSTDGRNILKRGMELYHQSFHQLTFYPLMNVLEPMSLLPDPISYSLAINQRPISFIFDGEDLTAHATISILGILDQANSKFYSINAQISLEHSFKPGATVADDYWAVISDYQIKGTINDIAIIKSMLLGHAPNFLATASSSPKLHRWSNLRILADVFVESLSTLTPAFLDFNEADKVEENLPPYLAARTSLLRNYLLACDQKNPDYARDLANDNEMKKLLYLYLYKLTANPFLGSKKIQLQTILNHRIKMIGTEFDSINYTKPFAAIKQEIKKRLYLLDALHAMIKSGDPLSRAFIIACENAARLPNNKYLLLLEIYADAGLIKPRIDSFYDSKITRAVQRNIIKELIAHSRTFTRDDQQEFARQLRAKRDRVGSYFEGLKPLQNNTNSRFNGVYYGVYFPLSIVLALPLYQVFSLSNPITLMAYLIISLAVLLVCGYLGGKMAVWLHGCSLNRHDRKLASWYDRSTPLAMIKTPSFTPPADQPLNISTNPTERYHIKIFLICFIVLSSVSQIGTLSIALAFIPSTNISVAGAICAVEAILIGLTITASIFSTCIAICATKRYERTHSHLFARTTLPDTRERANSGESLLESLMGDHNEAFTEEDGIALSSLRRNSGDVASSRGEAPRLSERNLSIFASPPRAAAPTTTAAGTGLVATGTRDFRISAST